MPIKMPPTPEDTARCRKEDVDPNELPNFFQDSSSEEETNVADDGGYSLLPQEPDYVEDEGNETTERNESSKETANGLAVDDVVRAVIDRDANEIMGGSGPSLFETPTPESRAIAELWNQPTSGDRLQMDHEQMKKVTDAMSNIELPLCNHPAWAKYMTDEQLKAELTNRLQKANST